MATIGIDLGTTKTCISVFQNGKAEIIQNGHANRLTASYVAFTKTDILIGDSAKNQAGMNPENTIFSVKRIIGRRLNDEHINKNSHLWPFNIVDDGGKQKIEVTCQEETKKYTPEEISALILIKMKDMVENYLKYTVDDAVIIVPACFSDSQRQATKDAGKIAGLNILRILNAPTAVSLAYGHQRNLEGKKNILVYDFGGGHCDASIISILKNTYEVKGTSGDSYLGGEDFDNCLLNHFLQEIRKTWSVDLSCNKRAVVRLKKEAERIKRVLSSGPLAIAEIDSLYDGNDFETRITREEFEEICVDLFKRALLPVQNVLRDLGMEQSDIDDVVLVGGSSRTPKIQTMIQAFFNGKLLTMNLNAEETGAYGAAILADSLDENKNACIVKDVTPFTLEIQHEIYDPMEIVKANTPIPFEFGFIYEGNESTFQFWISEQEKPKVKKFLGKFKISRYNGLFSKYPTSILFNIDNDGILNVTAQDKITCNTNLITLESLKGGLSNQEISRMKENAKHFEKVENELKKCVAARSEIEKCAYSIKRDVSNLNLNEAEKSQVVSRCHETIRWLDGNNSKSLTEYRRVLEDLQNFVASLKEARSGKYTRHNTKQRNDKKMSPSQLERTHISAEAKRLKDGLENIRKCREFRSNLLMYLIKLRKEVSSLGAVLSNNGSEEIKYCHSVIAWLSDTPLRSQAEYENLLQDLKIFERSVEEKKKENMNEREKLEKYVSTLILEANASKMKDSAKSLITSRCSEVMRWLGSYSYQSIEAMQQKKTDLEILQQSLTLEEQPSCMQRFLNWLFGNK